MTTTTKTITGVYSKRGLPTLTECGGSMTNSGYCRLIASPYYNKMKPIHIPTGGQLSNSDHAIFAVRENCIVLEGTRQRDDFNLKIYKVINIETVLDAPVIHLELINNYSRSEWDEILPSEAVKFVASAIDKMNDYHCRTPYWYLSDRD
jgi:hypothetical protein